MREPKGYVEINSCDVDIRTIDRWTKNRKQYVVAENGRWGPSWLHRLVLRMAKNLGMVGYERSHSQTFQVNRIDIRQPDITRAIIEATNVYLRRGFAPDELIAVVGSSRFAELRQEVRLETPDMRFNREMPSDSRDRVYVMVENFNLAVVVTPYFNGVAVLPKRHFR